MNRGTTVLLSPIDNAFPQWLGTSNVNNLFPNTQTNAYTRKYQPAHFLSLCATPPSCHRPNPTCPKCATFVQVQTLLACECAFDRMYTEVVQESYAQAYELSELKARLLLELYVWADTREMIFVMWREYLRIYDHFYPEDTAHRPDIVSHLQDWDARSRALFLDAPMVLLRSPHLPEILPLPLSPGPIQVPPPLQVVSITTRLHSAVVRRFSANVRREIVPWEDRAAAQWAHHHSLPLLQAVARACARPALQALLRRTGQPLPPASDWVVAQMRSEWVLWPQHWDYATSPVPPGPPHPPPPGLTAGPRDAGRSAMSVADFLAHPTARVALLTEAEVVALRLHTGPAYRVMDASLRSHTARFPATQWALDCAVGKLARRAPARTLVRGVRDGPGAAWAEEYDRLPDWAAGHALCLQDGAYGMAEATPSAATWAGYGGHCVIRLNTWASGSAHGLCSKFLGNAADVGWVMQYPQGPEMLLPRCLCVYFCLCLGLFLAPASVSTCTSTSFPSFFASASASAFSSPSV